MDVDVTTSATINETEEGQSEEEKKAITKQTSAIKEIQRQANIIYELKRGDEPILQLTVGEEENNNE